MAISINGLQALEDGLMVTVDPDWQGDDYQYQDCVLYGTSVNAEEFVLVTPNGLKVRYALELQGELRKKAIQSTREYRTGAHRFENVDNRDLWVAGFARIVEISYYPKN